MICANRKNQRGPGAPGVPVQKSADGLDMDPAMLMRADVLRLDNHYAD